MSFNKDIRLLQQLLAEAKERELKEKQQTKPAEKEIKEDTKNPANLQDFNAQETEETLAEHAYKLTEEIKKTTDTLEV